MGKYEGIDAEQVNVERPTDNTKKKPEAMFLNKKDGSGRAYAIELKKVKLNLAQIKKVNQDGKLLGFTETKKFDPVLNKNVITGGIGKVPKDYEVPKIKEEEGVK